MVLLLELGSGLIIEVMSRWELFILLVIEDLPAKSGDSFFELHPAHFRVLTVGIDLVLLALFRLRLLDKGYR